MKIGLCTSTRWSPGTWQLLAFHQDRADRLPEQTQRHVYGSAARAQRRGGGIIKIYYWEGEPQRELNIATTISFIYFIYLNHGITYLQQRDPLPLIQYNSIHTVQYLYIAKLYFTGRRPKPLKFTYSLLPLHLNPLSKF